MDERLTGYALARGGVFTSAEARALDVDEAALRRWRRSEGVVRVRRDAYVLAERWQAAGPEERLALRTRAVLRTRPGETASHQSALALHGLPLHGVDLLTVDVIGDGARVRLASGLRSHPGAGLPVVVADGYRCVSPAVGVGQVLLREGLVPALIPLDAALHRGLTDLEEVAAFLDPRCPTPRLRSRADVLLGRADAACESPGETLTRLPLVDAGYSVRSQVELDDIDGRIGRVDLLVERRVVVEFDGAVKYGGAEGRDALVAEKRREDRIRGLGYAVVRVTWADLAHPERIVARVRRELARLSSSDGVVAAS